MRSKDTEFARRYIGTHAQAHMYDQRTRGMATTNKHTCIISAQEEWRQPDTEALLGKAVERVLLATKALHTKKNQEKPTSRIQNRFEAHRASNKATRLFLTK